MGIYALNDHRAPFFKQRSICSTTKGCIILFVRKRSKYSKSLYFKGFLKDRKVKKHIL